MDKYFKEQSGPGEGFVTTIREASSSLHDVKSLLSRFISVQDRKTAFLLVLFDSASFCFPFKMIFKRRCPALWGGVGGEAEGAKFQGSRVEVEGFKHRRIFCLQCVGLRDWACARRPDVREFFSVARRCNSTPGPLENFAARHCNAVKTFPELLHSSR